MDNTDFDYFDMEESAFMEECGQAANLEHLEVEQEKKGQVK